MKYLIYLYDASLSTGVHATDNAFILNFNSDFAPIPNDIINIDKRNFIVKYRLIGMGSNVIILFGDIVIK